jgi:hypothetical protein
MKDGKRIYGWFGALIVCQMVMVLTQVQSVNLLKRIDNTTTSSEQTLSGISTVLTQLTPNTSKEIKGIYDGIISDNR